MADEQTTLSPVTFVYEYTGHGWAQASISNGADIYAMSPSYAVANDPLFELAHAVVEILRYGGEARCEWFYEPALDRWALHRDGDSLCISIRGIPHGFPGSSFPSFDAGELKFTATCDLWKFAAKVRLAVSRLAPVGQDDPTWHPTWVQRTAEYRALCGFLEAHKHTQPPTPGKHKR